MHISLDAEHIKMTQCLVQKILFLFSSYLFQKIG